MAKLKNRERALDDGFYDGRFRPRTQDTKKQKQQKRNNNKNWYNEED